MPKKTVQQLQSEIDLEDKIRKDSDAAYAVKLVEQIVFGFLSAFAIAVIGGIVALLINHFK